MTQENKIGTIEAIFLIVTVMLNHIILNLPKVLLDSTGSASILNIIYISIIALGIVYLICRLLKFFPNQDILDISEFLGGKVLKYVIGVLFMIYFLFFSSIFLRTFCESLKIIYFPRVPVMIIILFFIIGIVMCSRFGINAIIRANLIFMPIIILSIISIFFANTENFVVQRMFPLLGKGFFTTFFSGISNLFAFSGIALLYFVPPILKDSKTFKKVSLISVLLSGLALLCAVATLLFIFPSIVTTDEILPLYLASRFIDFGKFFQRLDAVFLMIWIIAMISYLSILLSFVVSIFRKISNFKYPYIAIYTGAIIVFLVSILPKNYAQVHFLETSVFKYLVLGLVFIFSLTVLILATLKFKKINKVKGDSVND